MIAFCFAVGYFPASGYRVDLGELTNVSMTGYSWSSSTFGNATPFSALFYADKSIVSVYYGRFRHVSRPVRCVQELTCILY